MRIHTKAKNVADEVFDLVKLDDTEISGAVMGRDGDLFIMSTKIPRRTIDVLTSSRSMSINTDKLGIFGVQVGVKAGVVAYQCRPMPAASILKKCL